MQHEHPSKRQRTAVGSVSTHRTPAPARRASSCPAVFDDRLTGRVGGVDFQRGHCKAAGASASEDRLERGILPPPEDQPRVEHHTTPYLLERLAIGIAYREQSNCHTRMPVGSHEEEQAGFPSIVMMNGIT